MAGSGAIEAIQTLYGVCDELAGRTIQRDDHLDMVGAMLAGAVVGCRTEGR
jgi:hypothetical protein